MNWISANDITRSSAAPRSCATPKTLQDPGFLADLEIQGLDLDFRFPGAWPENPTGIIPLGDSHRRCLHTVLLIHTGLTLAMSTGWGEDPGGRENQINDLDFPTPEHHGARHSDMVCGSEARRAENSPEKTVAPSRRLNAGYASSRIPNSSSAGRTRGYSLQRSLFSHNALRQADEGQRTFEMDYTKTGGEKEDAGQPTAVVTVQESPEVHSDLELPLYRRWMAKNTSRTSAIRTLSGNYRQLKDRIFRQSDVPRSIDGRRVRVNVVETDVPIDERTGKPYISNLIRSCRYTPWNFLPRQLVAQFSKLANLYFLCVSILQMIPNLSTTGTYTTLVPLMFFVGISMAKEGYDDIRRNRLDREENERTARVLRTSSASSSSTEWQEKSWTNVRVGDAVQLKRNDDIPADLILLHVEGSNQPAYIETKSLDGETNLKSKTAPIELSASCRGADVIARLKADFVVEDPNLDLYKFDGKLMINGNTLPLTNSEVLYRGSVLRNTPSVIGLVIYTGEECRIRMNANKTPRTKAPTLQAKANRVVVFVAALVVFIAVILTLSHLPWRRSTQNISWYLDGARVPIGQILTSFIIMLNTMLPLSLYISLEIVKVIQIFMMLDVDMYDAESDIPMEPHTSTINEELGQVSYIFSDKTGTLTNNSMKFRKLSVAGTAWLHDVDLQDEAIAGTGDQKTLQVLPDGKGKRRHIDEWKRSSLSRVFRKFSTSGVDSSNRNSQDINDATERTRKASSGGGLTLEAGKTQDLLEHISRQPNTLFARKARFFILSLALCHTCVPEKDDRGNITYQAASPDELALVSAAQELGFIVTDRHSNTVTVKTRAEDDEESPIYETYEVLDVIEFSSARKRMSIVVRFPDKRICLISKGADSTIISLLRLSDLAASNVQAVERRASRRRSVDAQQALKRRSTQLSRKSGSIHELDAISQRLSDFSGGRAGSARNSIDYWPKEREGEASTTQRRRSSQFYSPRPSMQLVSRNSESYGVRTQSPPYVTPRTSMQRDYSDEPIGESIVIDDNALFERCFQHIDDFATDGLRTLLYAFRFLTDKEYGEWKQVYSSATTSLVDRQDKIERAAELLETRLELMGATAIEDKLQQGVPDAIERLRRAGIKMWMLTGDKRETAINVGRSCRLIKDSSTVIVLDHELGELNTRMTDAFALINNEHTAHSVLVIDGQTLTVIEADQAAKAMFTDVAVRAESVICCRASPSQKASLVKTIRTKVKGSVTLAIGDGANDIAMIQEAHLGIGIAGKEGFQAARTSDYSIAQFRFLLKLLLVHGRWNYIRICKYLLGTLWKETLFFLCQAMYQRWNGYTGTSLYEPWSLTMFNSLFTSLPVIFMGIFEKDLAASTLLAVPELYNIGRRNRGFSFFIYLRWATLAACEAVLVYFFVYEIYPTSPFSRDQELYAFGDLVFSACVIIISMKMLCIELHNKCVPTAIAFFLSVGGWWLWNIILSVVYPFNPIYYVHHALLDRFGRSFLWWITLILVVTAACLVEVTIRTVKAALWPSDVDVFQALEQDPHIRRRFEDAAAGLLLQQQHTRDRTGVKKSSQEIAREEADEADRVAQVEALLNKPRGNRNETRNVSGLNQDRRASASQRRSATQMDESSHEMKEVSATPAPGQQQQRRSIDIGELFSKGNGAVNRT